MRASQLILIVGLWMAAGTASAAYVWTNELTVDSYTFKVDSAGYTFFTVKVKEDISGTGCAATDSGEIFSWWTTSPGVNLQLAQNTIVAADAQGRKIKIQYDDTQCSGAAGWLIRGITVQPAT